MGYYDLRGTGCDPTGCDPTICVEQVVGGRKYNFNRIGVLYIFVVIILHRGVGRHVAFADHWSGIKYCGGCITTALTLDYCKTSEQKQ